MTSAYACKLRLMPTRLQLMPTRENLMINEETQGENCLYIWQAHWKCWPYIPSGYNFLPGQWCWRWWNFGNHQFNIQNQTFQLWPIKFLKPTQLIKVAHFPQLMPQTWQIVTTADLDGVAEDKILTINQSTSKNNISNSGTSLLRNPTSMIKVSSCHQIMPWPWQIVTQSTSKNNISMSKTSCHWNPTQMIKVSSCHQVMPLPW